MRFESRIFTLAKDPDRPEENQDSCRVDPERGLAVIADGVSSAIFSRQWAALLTEAVLAEPPDPQDRDAWARWLAGRRQAWSGRIDASNLAWFQKPKLREGAFSTLLWVAVAPATGPADDGDGAWRLCAHAVGDSCLFVVRGGAVVRKFPLQQAADFEASPLVVGSVDLNRDGLVQFHCLDERCRPGDLVVLCTDALAEWAMREEESGGGPAWKDLWDKSEDALREEVLALRADRRIRCDDSTLALLRLPSLVEPATAPGAAAPEDTESPPPLPDLPPVPGIPAAPATAALPPAASPPPLPGPEPPEPSWLDRVKSLSGQIAGHVKEGVSRGLKKLREVRDGAEAALRKRRDPPGDDDAPEDRP